MINKLRIFRRSIKCSNCKVFNPGCPICVMWQDGFVGSSIIAGVGIVGLIVLIVYIILNENLLS